MGDFTSTTQFLVTVVGQKSQTYVDSYESNPDDNESLILNLRPIAVRSKDPKDYIVSHSGAPYEVLQVNDDTNTIIVRPL